MSIATIHDFDEWRRISRKLLREGVPPHDATFGAAETHQLLLDLPPSTVETPQHVAPGEFVRVPRAFVDLAKTVACHRDPSRWDLLYRVLWRLTHGEAELLEIPTDDDVHRLRLMEKAVERDVHKTHAFVRFRKIVLDGVNHFIAWHRPDHRILKLAAPFFARRFPSMHWSILTPDESAHWDGKDLRFAEGVPASEAPSRDDLEDLWRTYYGSIFNPARIKVKAMVREMPRRHWATLPETSLIPQLLADAPRRVEAMRAHTAGKPGSAADFLPDRKTLKTLEAAAKHCEGCDLYKRATQTVFGRGSSSAKLILVGEQPGDQEDLEGEPFVGPAGKVLDEALTQAGIDRKDVYVTNAVKHFHWEERGVRRLHKKPPARAISACMPWLEAEVEVIKPEVIVCLGATAAQAVVGREARIMKQRGQMLASRFCEKTLMTWHPSAILRAPDEEARHRMRQELVRDLKVVACTIENCSHHEPAGH